MRRRAHIVLALSLLCTSGAVTASAVQTAAEVPAQGAAHRRAGELLQVLASGDATALDTYLRANASPDFIKRNPGDRLAWARYMMGDKPVLDSFREESARSVVAVVRNPISGRWNSFFVAVEAEAPNRITRASLDPFTMRPDDAPLIVPKSETERMARIDAIASRLARADRFSGVVLVARGDKVILEKAYGLADRGFGVPNTVKTRFNVASIDKIFTALALARLVEQGKLSYDDPLGKFIDYPDAATAAEIKIKHLLSHTSGLGDYTEPPYDEFRSTYLSLDDYMKLLDKQKPVEPQFEPGKGWSYSNTGMLLIGKVIEKVTGEDYYDHIQRVIFDAAGMTGATDLRLDEINANVATLYENRFEGGRMSRANFTAGLPARSAPDGGSIMTARDLLRLATAIGAGKIVRPETFAMMATPKDELGAKGRYGFGVMNMNQRLGSEGRDVIGHGGDTNGACASFAMVRDAGVPYTIVLLSNSYLGSCFPVGETVLEMIPPAPGNPR